MRTYHSNIYLVGLPNSGVSTLAKYLRRLSFDINLNFIEETTISRIPQSALGIMLIFKLNQPDLVDQVEEILSLQNSSQNLFPWRFLVGTHLDQLKTQKWKEQISSANDKFLGQFVAVSNLTSANLDLLKQKIDLQCQIARKQAGLSISTVRIFNQLYLEKMLCSYQCVQVLESEEQLNLDIFDEDTQFMFDDPCRRNFKIKQNKPKKVSSQEELRRLQAKFEQDKQKYMPQEPNSFFSEIFDDFDDDDETPKPNKFTKAYMQQFIDQHQKAKKLDVDYTSLFLNPQSTTIECQRAYVKFCQEANAHLLEVQDQSLKKLTQFQYYPPLKRYNDVLQIIKQISGMEKSMNIDFPQLNYFFDRPQSELFEMIAFVNASLNRALGQEEKLTEQQQQLNQQYLASQEVLALQFLEQIFRQPQIFNDLQPIRSDDQKLIFRTQLLGQNNVVIIQQNLLFHEELKQVYIMNNLKQGIQNSDVLKQKELFKAPRFFNFEYFCNDVVIKSPFELFEQLMQTYAAVVYICQVDDFMSPFVKQSTYWKLREKYILFCVGCSQQTVTIVCIHPNQCFE